MQGQDRPQILTGDDTRACKPCQALIARPRLLLREPPGPHACSTWSATSPGSPVPAEGAALPRRASKCSLAFPQTVVYMYRQAYVTDSRNLAARGTLLAVHAWE